APGDCARHVCHRLDPGLRLDAGGDLDRLLGRLGPGLRDRHEVRAELLQPVDGLEELALALVGLRRKELEGEDRRRAGPGRKAVANPHGRPSLHHGGGAFASRFFGRAADDIVEAMSERSERPRRSGDVAVATRTERKLQRPKMYKVLLHNDDYTTMEFVVYILQGIFHHQENEAMQIMLHVHKHGIGVAGVYTYEVAESRVAQVEALAREHEFPLRCSLEEA